MKELVGGNDNTEGCLLRLRSMAVTPEIQVAAHAQRRRQAILVSQMLQKNARVLGVVFYLGRHGLPRVQCTSIYLQALVLVVANCYQAIYVVQ